MAQNPALAPSKVCPPPAERWVLNVKQRVCASQKRKENFCHCKSPEG